MICIHCRNDAKYSERRDGKCPRCSARFAFEPRLGHPFTDVGFENALKRVSADGNVRWSQEHLRHELSRRMKRVPLVLMLFGLVFAAVTFAVNIKLGVVVSVLQLLIFAVAAWRRRAPWLRLSPDSFHQQWVFWALAHGEPLGQIVRRKRQQSEPARPLPSDISQYSFDRAVICDRAETVNLLLANNFHFENNCAVLSVGGYPPEAFETVRAMLKQNPKLVVFVLHDATVAGCMLAQRIALDPAWFPTAKVIDVGLRPVHAAGLRGSFEPQANRRTASELSDREERVWLARQTVELFAIIPEQVIKRLFRAIARSERPDAGLRNMGAYFIDTQSFARRAASSDGGGDSFG